MARNPAASLEEMRGLLAHLPGPDLEAGTAAALRERQLTKPAGALGRLEELAAWRATWQGRHPPRVDQPRTCVFAGNHGVAARGVSAYPGRGDRADGAELHRRRRRGEPALPTRRRRPAGLRDGAGARRPRTSPTAPAMGEERMRRAMAYGMMAVEPGIDVLALGEMGIANTTSAAALCVALFGGSAADWAGPGTGVAGAALDRKTRGRRRGAGAAPRRARRPARDCCAGSAATSWRRSPARSWRRGWPGCRWCSTASPAPRRPRCSSPPTRARSTIASSPTLGRARPRRLLAAIGKTAAARSRHAAGRGLGRDAGHRHPQGGRRLPHRHGHLRRGGGQRAGVSDYSPICISAPRWRALRKAMKKIVSADRQVDEVERRAARK